MSSSASTNEPNVFLVNDRVVYEEWTEDDPDGNEREITTWYLARFVGVSGPDGGDTIHFRVFRRVFSKRKPAPPQGFLEGLPMPAAVIAQSHRPDEWDVLIPLEDREGKLVATVAWRTGVNDAKLVSYALTPGTTLTVVPTPKEDEYRPVAGFRRALTEQPDG